MSFAACASSAPSSSCSSASVAAPPPQDAGDYVQCHICLGSADLDTMLQCRCTHHACHTRVHAHCYMQALRDVSPGAESLCPLSRDLFPLWLCDMCSDSAARLHAERADCARVDSDPHSAYACRACSLDDWMLLNLKTACTPSSAFPSGPWMHPQCRESAFARPWPAHTRCEYCGGGVANATGCAHEGCARAFHATCYLGNQSLTQGYAFRVRDEARGRHFTLFFCAQHADQGRELRAGNDGAGSPKLSGVLERLFGASGAPPASPARRTAKRRGAPVKLPQPPPQTDFERRYGTLPAGKKSLVASARVWRFKRDEPGVVSVRVNRERQQLEFYLDAQGAARLEDIRRSALARLQPRSPGELRFIVCMDSEQYPKEQTLAHKQRRVEAQACVAPDSDAEDETVTEDEDDEDDEQQVFQIPRRPSAAPPRDEEEQEQEEEKKEEKEAQNVPQDVKERSAEQKSDVDHAFAALAQFQPIPGFQPPAAVPAPSSALSQELQTLQRRVREVCDAYRSARAAGCFYCRDLEAARLELDAAAEWDASRLSLWRARELMARAELHALDARFERSLPLFEVQ